MQNELSQLRARQVRGNIVSLKDLERGCYLIDVNDTVTKSVVGFELPVSWDIKEHNIRVGDFASKDTNSESLIIYQRENGVYQECCELLVSI